MRSLGRIAAGLSILVMAAGCTESNSVVMVERDGSGTLLVSAYFSPQITQMLAGATASMGGEEASADPLAAMIKDQSETLGEGVSLVRSERKKNARGWEGFEAEYRFRDIRKVRIQPGQTPGSSDSDEDSLVRFEFTPGDRATLIVHMPKEAGEDDPTEPANEEMMQSMWPMMKSMFEGMRIQFSVQPASPVIETNGQFLDRERRAVTLLDLAMDSLLENEQAVKILQSQASDSMKRLGELGIDAARIEPPGKRVAITF